ILASIKCNLAVKPPALAYRVVGAENGAARVEWLGPSAHSAATLLAQPVDGADRNAQEEASAFLREALAGGPRPAEELQREARRLGIADITLRRSKAQLGVRARRSGFGREGRWEWALPAIDDHADLPAAMITYGGDDHLCADQEGAGRPDAIGDHHRPI